MTLDYDKFPTNPTGRTVTIDCVKENRLLTVILGGRLDSSSVHDLETKLKEEMVEIDKLVFDVTDLEYLSSAGLRVLLASHKLMSGNMEIKNPNSILDSIFKMTGMSTIFNFTRG